MNPSDRQKVRAGGAAHRHDPRDIQRGQMSPVQGDQAQFAKLRDDLAGGSVGYTVPQGRANEEPDALARILPTRVQMVPWSKLLLVSAFLPEVVVPKNPKRLSLQLCNRIVDAANTWYLWYSYGPPLTDINGQPVGHLLLQGQTNPQPAGVAVPIDDVYVWVYSPTILPGPTVVSICLAFEGIAAEEANL